MIFFRRLMFLAAAVTLQSYASDSLDYESVKARVEQWQPKPEEKRFDLIGWAEDIRHARKLSQESGRPMFLFTHDGRMNLGRC